MGLVIKRKSFKAIALPPILTAALLIKYYKPHYVSEETGRERVSYFAKLT